MIAQTTWGWFIVWYLFLAGVGAGAYTVGVLSEFLKIRSRLASRIGVVLGAPLVLVGTVFLFFDIGQPGNFIYVFSNPSSMIMIGSTVISVFMVIGLVHIGFWVWPFKVLERAQRVRRVLGLVGVVFAFGTALYTGVLLGVLAAVPFWNNSVLPVLFLVSAMSTGLSSVIFGLAIFHGRRVGDELGNLSDSIKALARVDGMLLVGELFVLMMYLSVVSGPLPAVGVSIQLVLNGYLAPIFWGGLVLAGLLVPLMLDVFAHRSEGATRAGGGVMLYLLAGVLVLTGGLILRYVVLAAGVPVAYQPMFGTQPFFMIPAFLGSSGADLTSLVPQASTYFLLGAFFVALLLVYMGGSRLFLSSKAAVAGGRK